MVGRRGPVQAACTAKELREILGTLIPIPFSYSTFTSLASFILLECATMITLNFYSEYYDSSML